MSAICSATKSSCSFTFPYYSALVSEAGGGMRRRLTYKAGLAVLFLVLLDVDRVDEDTRVYFFDQLAELDHSGRGIGISWKRV